MPLSRMACYCSNGLKRRAEDICTPSTLSEGELTEYIADVFHEWASANNDSVRRMS